MDQEQLSQFAGEVSDILENYDCAVTVIYIDTKINNVEEYEKSDLPLVLNCGRSGGGTVQKAAYDYVAEELRDTSVLIAFTNSYYFDWKEINQPSCPALMACTEEIPSSQTPDWMETIDIS
jgi:predicted metal-dependent peptidase